MLRKSVCESLSWTHVHSFAFGPQGHMKDALYLMPFGSFSFPLESPHVLVFSERSER